MRLSGSPEGYYEQLRNDGLSPDEARRRVNFRFRTHQQAQGTRGTERWSPPDDDPVHLRAERRQAEYDRDEVERSLADAEALIEALEAEVAMLTRLAALRRQPIPDEPIGAGADRTTLLVRARTLVRRALHPDTRPASEACHATGEFQRAESLFDQLLDRA